ncbi:MAG: Phage protein [uncultured Clostridium sp.]
MKLKIRLCYRIEKEAGWGEDEYGNPTEVYSCVKVNCTTYNVPKNQYKELVEVGIRITASQFKIAENLITPITLNEYLDHVDKD